MKIIRFALVLILFVSCASFGAPSSDFQSAAKLLTAARRGDIQTVQILINSGADVNYVDSTGLSLVCTAVMNNDKRAIQVLQMYGADASNCDRQIKKYRQKAKTAVGGEEYGFFSGLSSSHVLALSALGVAAVVGGLVLLTDVFDSDNDNNSWGGGGSHGSGGGGGSSTPTKYFSIPYGPAYLTSTGALDTGFDISENLSDWDTGSTLALRVTDFNFLRTGTSNNFVAKGLNPLLQNYLLAMHGYYSLASGYMGQNIFRDSANAYVPVLPAIEGAQGRPVRVALITGNGINPAGSADSGAGITYAVGTSLDSSTPTVDKYLNNTLNDGNETENSGYDFSGSGSAFNPFADVNDSALGKIVAGWEGTRPSNVGDLYGFVPNGQLAIYRTGNGSVWNELPVTARTNVGTFNDADGVAGLSYVATSENHDTLTINGITYTVQSALSLTTVTNPTVTINGVTFDLSSNSNMFVGVCPTELTDCTNIAIYVGTDGGWYVNSTGGNDVDVVYINVGGTVYTYKEKVSGGTYTNFEAINAAVGKTYSVAGDTSSTGVDLIANVNVIPTSRNTDYLTVKTFTKAANTAGVSDLKTFYSNQIDSYYGSGQGGIANNMFNNYNTTKPMLIMPAGDYLYRDNSTGAVYYDTLDATFENYAPIIYGNSLNHDFMTIVGVEHKTGTSTATTISGYGDGTGSSYGPIRLSMWYDGESPTTSNVYASRKCGIAGTGNGSVDPWCFAAIGPSAEMATAAAAGSVASVKSAFSYMTNDQIFTLLALTADGPYLAADTDGTVFSSDTLYEHLRAMYELPYEFDEDSLSVDDYLDAFKDVFGYGLINLERAVTPGYSVYYYDSVSGNIVSTSGKRNKFWGNVSTNTSRASSTLSLTNRGAITTSFYDVLESVDGTLSLPRVWTETLAMANDYKRGLYLGDLLGDFVVDSKAKKIQKVGNLEFGMSLSPRAYNDNFNCLDNLRVAFVGNDFDVVGQYQRYLTDGESRFNGRANGVLALTANAVSSDVVYKVGKFGFGARAFSGAITDESLLENDPVISSQFEPGRLGFTDGGAFDIKYDNDKFGFDVSVGMMRETNTVLGMYSDGLLGLRGGNTRYVDAVVEYKPFENVKLSLRGTFADTNADVTGELISELSNIKSNAFAFGADIDGFGLTVALPLAVVDGRMGYSYAEFEVSGDNGEYEVLLNNPHTEYIDLSPQKRELRFSTSYKKSLSELTDAGVEFMYRVNPNNTDMFGNESVLMFKLHRRVGF